MITIIEKISIVDGEVNNTPIGYSTDVELINIINEQYDDCLGEFLGKNRTKLENGKITINSFFETTPHTFEARTQTDADTELIEITNINQL